MRRGAASSGGCPSEDATRGWTNDEVAFWTLYWVPGPSHRITRPCAFAGVRTHLGCFVFVRSVLNASSDTSITVPLVGDPVGRSSSATVSASLVVRDLQSPWSRVRLYGGAALPTIGII
ncbi:hypothetical protein CGRA01v4_05802 [Colletotrichum graminicola]|uniref:Uncharacterized protein n=1 Tax=Colletotrichum graminicola (strain M1.001 / M2 / FGSC 10212) TaxID=645133 RepID=E3QWQ2_COLGM|nr:uncharacterized protein GLRG_10434 [Colletotrichum graminicola M1.001]EFQ35290.1 hypothetical protein GLRG_10434 [Colletotrichum graminicola M1.001]WDK14521.1 hypothetical protein CGRA01v4_05802 [Colletotrichum graminicola]